MQAVPTIGYMGWLRVLALCCVLGARLRCVELLQMQGTSGGRGAAGLAVLCKRCCGIWAPALGTRRRGRAPNAFTATAALASRGAMS